MMGRTKWRRVQAAQSNWKRIKRGAGRFARIERAVSQRYVRSSHLVAWWFWPTYNLHHQAHFELAQPCWHGIYITYAIKRCNLRDR